jgi:PEP-CTERM motif
LYATYLIASLQEFDSIDVGTRRNGWSVVDRPHRGAVHSCTRFGAAQRPRLQPGGLGMKTVFIKHLLAAFVLVAVSGVGPAQAAATVFNDEAAFRAAAGPITTYGFETHTLAHSTDLASPLLAGQLDNSFGLAYSGLNAFQIVDDAADPNVVDGTHFLFTHSSAAVPNYTLTFSNFGGINAAVTAFGLTVVDFASNIQDPVTITFDTGALAGTLLSVVGGQPDYTQNFVGLTVDPGEAFASITLTLNDIGSGFQSFDKVLFSEQQAAIPEPATLLLIGLGGLLMAWLPARPAH